MKEKKSSVFDSDKYSLKLIDFYIHFLNKDKFLHLIQ